MHPKIYYKENNVLAKGADDLIALQLCPYKEKVQKLQLIFQKYSLVNEVTGFSCKHLNNISS